jgi:mannose-1-phosphate guanylyltransferase
MRSALILAGGRGERFWPMSRPGHPKQLLPLADGKILLTVTLARLDGIVEPEHTFVLTGRDLAGPVARLVGDRARVVAEPMGRNTAPAVGLAAYLALGAGVEDAMIVLPADHPIPDVDVFRRDLRNACVLAEEKDALVTFGIPPDRPETGYGYVERGTPIPGPWERAFTVAQFREKPDLETARRYVGSGTFFWNSGMFAWRPRILLEGLAAHRPALAHGLAALAAPAQAWASGDTGALDDALDAHFGGLESISIDYALMEKAKNSAMIQAAFEWDDLGSWGAWARRQAKDERGNVVAERAVAIDSDDCVVLGGGERPVVVLGGRGLVVVQHAGGTLVCPADRVDEVRKAVSELDARGWSKS